MKRIPILLAAALTPCTSIAGAQWQGRGEVGLLFSEGNVDIETGNLKLSLSRVSERWINDFSASFLRSTLNDTAFASRFETRAQTNYALSPRGYWFGGARYADDRFGSFDVETIISTGYRRQFIAHESTRLSAQLGIGYRRLHDPLTEEFDVDAMAQANIDLEHQLTDSTRVVNHLASESGSITTLFENRLSLEVSINKTLAVSLGTSIRFNSSPPPARDRTEKLTTVNLVYRFLGS